MSEREELALRVLAALRHPCEACTAVVRIMLEAPHDRHAFDRAVAALGLSSRKALARRMQHHGFPAPRELQPWLRVFALLDAWERRGQSLERHAYDASVEPAVVRRIVRRVTGTTWLTIRNQGLEHALARFSEQVGQRIRCRQVLREFT
jgi:hypothetical protein